MFGLLSCLAWALVALAAAAGGALAATASAGSEPARECAAAARHAEQRLGLPSGLIEAIALTESGRWDSEDHRSFAWPWTVTSGDGGDFFDSKAQALARIDALRRAGRSSIDVGCMQVNLYHHPDAFADLEQALDPARNVAYGAAFLAALEAETQSWDQAIERYHSSDPERGRAYRLRVLENWRRLSRDLPPVPVTMAAGAPAERASPPRTSPGQIGTAPIAPRPVALATGSGRQGGWRWLTPAGSFPIGAMEGPGPLVFAGPGASEGRAVLPGLVRVSARPPG